MLHYHTQIKTSFELTCVARCERGCVRGLLVLDAKHSAGNTEAKHHHNNDQGPTLDKFAEAEPRRALHLRLKSANVLQ